MSLLLEDVHAHYLKSHVLQGVSLSVARGETVCLLGRNGVGKSTTLKTIIGLVPASAGQIHYNSAAIERVATHRVAKLGIGYVPEERRIFVNTTVRENLLVGVKPAISRELEPWSIERIYQYFPRLAERENQRAGTLSGGEQQMLTIARSLMGNPELLLIDEPTEGLAPMLVEQVTAIIQAVKASGVAVLLVEQAIEMAQGLADRVYVMAKGTVVYSGTVPALLANDDVKRRYLQV